MTFVEVSLIADHCFVPGMRRGPKLKRIPAEHLTDQYVWGLEKHNSHSLEKFSKAAEELVALATKTPGVSESDMFACLVLQCKSLSEATRIAQLLESIAHFHPDIRRQIVKKAKLGISDDVIETYTSASANMGLSKSECPSLLCPPVGKCVECNSLLCLRTCTQATLWSSHGSLPRTKVTFACRRKGCQISYGPTRYTYLNTKNYCYYAENQTIVEGNDSNYFTTHLMTLFANLR